MKRELDTTVPLNEESNNNNEVTKKRRLIAAKDHEVIRFLIPSYIAGAVIGRKGQHIQKIRSEYNAEMSIDDCYGPERTIYISANLKSMFNVIKEVLKYFEEKNNETELRVLVHQSLAGCIIGKKGDKIKDIRCKIGCRVLRVYPIVAPQSTDRIIQIIGTKDQCAKAVSEVINTIRGTPIKGVIHNYDPTNFNEIFAFKYGGYGDIGNKMCNTNNSNNRKLSLKSQITDKYVDPWLNKDNFKIESNLLNSFSNLFNKNFEQNLIMTNNYLRNELMNFQTYENQLNRSFEVLKQTDNKNFENNFVDYSLIPNNENSTVDEDKVETNCNEVENKDVKEQKVSKVSLPSHLISILLGNNGEKLRNARNESGAHIMIDGPYQNSTDVIITITGNPDQIQMAQYLLQQNIRNSLQ